jgi:hypothetical protein
MMIETARLLESWKGKKVHITTVGGEHLDCELQDIGPSFIVVVYREAPMLVSLSAVITMRLFLSAADYDAVDGVTREF